MVRIPTLALSKSGNGSKVIPSSQPVIQAPRLYIILQCGVLIWKPFEYSVLWPFGLDLADSIFTIHLFSGKCKENYEMCCIVGLSGIRY